MRSGPTSSFILQQPMLSCLLPLDKAMPPVFVAGQHWWAAEQQDLHIVCMVQSQVSRFAAPNNVLLVLLLLCRASSFFMARFRAGHHSWCCSH